MARKVAFIGFGQAAQAFVGVSPVLPAKLATPLSLSGPRISVAASALRGLGRTRVETIEGAVGMASSAKMIRSMMIERSL